jgi:ATP-binding cassette, subfamily A (ABC1), member 3
VGTFILLAVPYVPAAFATFLVREREVKAKHQQLVSGVSIPAYWLAAFIWDNCTYQLTVWMIVILVSAFPNTDQFSGSNAIGKMIGLLILFGTAVSGFTYCMTFMFKTPSGAQIIIIFLVFILGLILSIVGSILRLIDTTHDKYMDVIRYIFALFPPFCLGDGFTNLAWVNIWSFRELKRGNKYSPGDWNITGMNLTFLAW